MKIIEAPNSVLSSKANSVRLPYPSDLPKVLAKMEKALLSAKDPKGVGLAAPQIGLDLRIFMAKPTEKSKIQVFINPKIIASSVQQSASSKAKNKKLSVDKSASGGRRQRKLEGCLSLPSIWGTVKRSKDIKLYYLDEKGKPHIKKLSGFMSIIAQHEIDHLEGILFPRRVLEQKGKLYKSFKNEKNEDEFEELEL
ncbi:MAG: peptide deformylase [Patescibacteria group bacterium]